MDMMDGIHVFAFSLDRCSFDENPGREGDRGINIPSWFWVEGSFTTHEYWDIQKLMEMQAMLAAEPKRAQNTKGCAVLVLPFFSLRAMQVRGSQVPKYLLWPCVGVSFTTTLTLCYFKFTARHHHAGGGTERW